jgi:hypothetical protein
MTKFQKRWLAALRSGEYKQGHGRLRIDDLYCCLGVACEVEDPSQWKPSFKHHGVVYGFYSDVNTGLIPRPVADKLGFSRSFITVLMELNDDLKFTFGMIADYAEAKIKNETAFKEVY